MSLVWRFKWVLLYSRWRVVFLYYYRYTVYDRTE